MTRIVLVGFGLLITNLGWGQNKVSFGVAGIAGASTLRVEQEGLGRSNASTELRPTFGGELFVNLRLSENFQFESKAGFVQCGTYNASGGFYQDAKFGYVSIKPFNLKAHVGYPHQFGIVAGPYVGLLIFGDRTYNYIDPVTDEKITASRDFKVGDSRNDDYKQLNVGIRFGPYMELENGVYASLDYVLGITDLSPEKVGASPSRINTLSLSVGFMLSKFWEEK